MIKEPSLYEREFSYMTFLTCSCSCILRYKYIYNWYRNSYNYQNKYSGNLCSYSCKCHRSYKSTHTYNPLVLLPQPLRYWEHQPTKQHLK